MALLIIFLLRNDLLQAWQGNISVDAPNRFVLNIQPDQRQAVFNELRASGLSHIELYPMVRGRLVEVNGRLVMPQDYRDENAQRLVDREFNLSYTDQLPKDNRIVSGQWFSNDDPQISLESGLAKTLGLKLSDQMTFDGKVAKVEVVPPPLDLRQMEPCPPIEMDVTIELANRMGMCVVRTPLSSKDTYTLERPVRVEVQPLSSE